MTVYQTNVINLTAEWLQTLDALGGGPLVLEGVAAAAPVGDEERLTGVDPLGSALSPPLGEVFSASPLADEERQVGVDSLGGTPMTTGDRPERVAVFREKERP